MAAFELLTRMEESERRKALFMAFVPLWQAINGADEVHSPYRRMVRLASAEAQKKASPVDAAARTVGDIKRGELERWLERMLDAWRAGDPGRTAGALGLSLPGGRRRAATRGGGSARGTAAIE